jgi:isopenicillin N synthase-like dioxygenase
MRLSAQELCARFRGDPGETLRCWGDSAIDVSALFAADLAARAATDQALMAAAGSCGFMLIHALPEEVPIGATARAQLLRLFDLAPEEVRPLWRQKFDPDHRNVYRGWFPLQKGFPTAKEGIDMGPDLAHARSMRPTRCAKRHSSR